MNRRDFIRVLAAGVTVPLVAKSIDVDAAVVRKVVTPPKRLPINGVEVRGDYIALQDYFHVGMRVTYDGTIYQEAVRITEIQSRTIDECAQLIVKHMNVRLKANGIPATVTNAQVKSALYGKMQ